MTSAPLDALLFDIGGTLLREEGYDLAAGVRAALADDAVERAALAPERWHDELAAWVAELHARPPHGASLAGWVRARLAPEARGRVDLDALEDRLWEAGVRMAASEGASEALSAAAARGLPMGALSNTIFSARRMRLALSEAGLAEPLAFVLASAELPRAKPDPLPFRLARERLGVEPGARVAYVGDSWAIDVEGACAAGLEAIWIAPAARAGASIPHRRIASLAELPALLDEASAG